MAVPINEVGTMGLAMTAGISVFTSFLPKLTDIAEHNSPEYAATVRVGEMGAAAVVLALGAMVAALIQDIRPFILAGVTAGALVIVYEAALSASPRKAAA